MKKIIPCATSLLLIHSAGSSASSLIEEVIVTAQKREQNLLDVSAAVSVVGGERLDNQSVFTLDELSSLIPTVFVSEGAAGSSVFIRGVGSGNNFGFEQSVGIFIDGVHYGRGRTSRNPYLDVERVEVLKGPQGVLFGKNVVAGAFNITTRKPTDTWEYSARAYWNPEYDGTEFSGVASGPISDTLGIRIVAKQYSVDGYLENTLPGQEDHYARDEFMSRVTLQWEPTDNFVATFKAEAGYYDVEGMPVNAVELSAPHLALTQAVDSAAEASFDYQKSGPGVGDPFFNREWDDTETENYTLNMVWDLDAYTLTSVSSFIGYDLDRNIDNDATNLSAVSSPEVHSHHARAQELRFTSNQMQSFSYTLGAYYSEERLKTRRQASVDISESEIAGVFGGIDRVGRNQQFSQINTSWAMFAEGIWSITDTWRLKAGVRYTEDEKEADKRMWYSDITNLDDAIRDAGIADAWNGAIGVEHEFLDVKRDTDNISPSVTLEWDVNSDLMVYANYSEGFKSGGFDEDLTSGVFSEFIYEDEEVESVALGAKWQLADGAAYLNAEVFRSDYSNLQISQFSVSSFLVGNAAESISEGLDIDARWQVTENVGLGASFAWLDARYESFPDGPCVSGPDGNPVATGPDGASCDLSGMTLPFAPETSGNVYVQYITQVFKGWELEAFADIVYKDDYVVAGDLDPDIGQDAFYKVNATVSLMSEDGRYRYSIIGKNLTDELTTANGNDIPLSNFYGGRGTYLFAQPPRTLALQAEIRF